MSTKGILPFRSCCLSACKMHIREVRLNENITILLLERSKGTGESLRSPDLDTLCFPFGYANIRRIKGYGTTWSLKVPSMSNKVLHISGWSRDMKRLSPSGKRDAGDTRPLKNPSDAHWFPISKGQATPWKGSERKKGNFTFEPGNRVHKSRDITE